SALRPSICPRPSTRPCRSGSAPPPPRKPRRRAPTAKHRSRTTPKGWLAGAQAKAMRDDGEAPETVDLEVLARDALRELVGLGPLGPLLEDDQADEIQVPRPDCILTVRDGQVSVVDPAFTSE